MMRCIDCVMCDCVLSGVTINTYKVIYNLIDDVKAAMEGKLRAVEEKQQLGEATVRLCVCMSGRGGGRILGDCVCVCVYG